jgi:hypothetical protein
MAPHLHSTRQAPAAAHLRHLQHLCGGAVPLLARLLLQARLKGGLVDQQGAALSRLQTKRAEKGDTGMAALTSAGWVYGQVTG